MLKNVLLTALVVVTSLTLGSAHADCAGTEPSLLSSFTALDPNGAPLTNPVTGGTIETPPADSGIGFCQSGGAVPRDVPPGMNSFRVRSPGDRAPSSGDVIVDGTQYPVAFTRGTDATGAAVYDSDVVYVNQVTTGAKEIDARVCFQSCEDTAYMTTNS